MKLFTKRLTQTQMIVLGYCIIIFLGAGLLMLPVSTKAGVYTPFTDALFTSTSAACVTGLVIADTFQYWSTFGQCVILCIIQIGGLGFMLRNSPAEEDWPLDKRDAPGERQYYAGGRNCTAG